VGEEYVAVVVPNGVKRVIHIMQAKGEHRFLSHTSILHLLHDHEACLIFGKQKTVCQARIFYPGRVGPERVNVILVCQELLQVTGNSFEGWLDLFELKTGAALEIPGFRSPRLRNRKLGS